MSERAKQAIEQRDQQRLARKKNYVIINFAGAIINNSQKSAKNRDKIFSGLGLDDVRKRELLSYGKLSAAAKNNIPEVARNTGVSEDVFKGVSELTIPSKPENIITEEEWNNYFNNKKYLSRGKGTEEHKNAKEYREIVFNKVKSAVNEIGNYSTGYVDFARLCYYLEKGMSKDEGEHIAKYVQDTVGIDFTMLESAQDSTLEDLRKALQDKIKMVDTVLEYRNYKNLNQGSQNPENPKQEKQ